MIWSIQARVLPYSRDLTGSIHYLINSGKGVIILQRSYRLYPWSGVIKTIKILHDLVQFRQDLCIAIRIWQSRGMLHQTFARKHTFFWEYIIKTNYIEYITGYRALQATNTSFAEHHLMCHHTHHVPIVHVVCLLCASSTYHVRHTPVVMAAYNIFGFQSCALQVMCTVTCFIMWSVTWQETWHIMWYITWSPNTTLVTWHDVMV